MITYSFHIRKEMLSTEILSAFRLCGWKSSIRKSCLHPAVSQYSQLSLSNLANAIVERKEQDKPGWIIYAFPLWAYPLISVLDPLLHVSEWEWSLWKHLHCWHPHKYWGAPTEGCLQRKKDHLCNSFIKALKISTQYVSISCLNRSEYQILALPVSINISHGYRRAELKLHMLWVCLFWLERTFASVASLKQSLR